MADGPESLRNMIAGKLKHLARKTLRKSHRLLQPVIPDKYFPYRLAGGRIYLNVKESHMMFMRALGLYEREKVSVMTSLLRAGSVFVDVGANKGDFTLLAAKIVGNSGRVLSFEPEPSNCHWIRKSIELNGYKNVELYEVALAAKNGITQLFLGQKSGWHTILPGRHSRDQGVIEVKIRTLDAVLEEAAYQKIDVMKIDVEGAELAVLEGAHNTLMTNDHLVLLVDIHPRLGVDPREVCGFLLDRGFRIYEMTGEHREVTHIGANAKEIMACRANVFDRLDQ